MFTDRGQVLVDLAKDYAYACGSDMLNIQALIAGITSHSEACILMSEATGLDPQALSATLADQPEPRSCQGRLMANMQVRSIFALARELAGEFPDLVRPELVDLRHIIVAAAMDADVCLTLKAKPISRDTALSLLSRWRYKDSGSPRINELAVRLNSLREDLLSRIFGQDHAIHQFVESLFNSEILMSGDNDKTAPRSLFLFAGPPGVGKTYLAELGASHLGRPLRRFDMSSYSDHQAHNQLVGFARTYQGSKPGLLTEFVKKNPRAMLIFDEIEKAHLNTMNLFLQILDAGILEDQYHEQRVPFKDTIIIFTTNAGKQLYDAPNRSGVHSANAGFHRQTILNALATEEDPRTGHPFFPEAICSRLSTGYPIMFNHLGVNELERVVRAEFDRTAQMLSKQYYKRISYDELVPMALVLREGASADARTLRSQAETFMKMEIFNFCQLFNTDRLEDVFNLIDHIEFSVEVNDSHVTPETTSLFSASVSPKVLLVADQDLSELYVNNISEINWLIARDPDDVIDMLARQEVDLVLLDIWIGRWQTRQEDTIVQFDHAPIAARGLERGQELLRKIHERSPNTPVYLLSLQEEVSDLPSSRSVGDALFGACVRAGGARGMIVSAYTITEHTDTELHRTFVSELLQACKKLYRENSAWRLAREHKVLSFDSVPRRTPSGRHVGITLRNLRLTRAVAAADARELLNEIDRPTIRFDDVIGARTAKDELQFFCDYMRNPRRYVGMGLRPPKGVLLYGPPGTGKTMLARAMAGESNAAFISTAASSFVTIWQGSGPQNIRDLFQRARRYAPAILFIDEIDAIGKERSGWAGSQGIENTLNALLTEMDGFTGADPTRPIFVLAATNFPVDRDARDKSGIVLDPALVRRFDRLILIELPDKSGRQQYLTKRLIGKYNVEVTAESVDRIASRSTGLSIDYLQRLVELASRSAARANGILTDGILEEAFEAMQHGDAKAWDARLIERVARHEAGHTVMYWLSGWCPTYVTVVARGQHGGYMEPCPEQVQLQLRTCEDLLAEIRVCLGGRASEVVFYGKDEGASSGASGDLDSATRNARALVFAYGMDDEFGLVSLTLEELTTGPMAIAANQAVNRILNKEFDKTVKALMRYRDYVDRIAATLIENNRMTGDEVRRILKPIGSNQLSAH